MLKVHKRNHSKDTSTSEEETDTSTEEDDKRKRRCKKKKGNTESFLIVKSKKDKWKTFYSYVLSFSQHYLDEWGTSLTGLSILKLSEFICSSACQIFGRVDIQSNPVAIVICPSHIFQDETEMTIPYLANDSTCLTEEDDNFYSDEASIEQAKFYILINVYGILELAKTSEIDYWGRSSSNVLSSSEVLRKINRGGRDKLALETNCRTVRIVCVCVLHALARIDLYCNKRAKLSNQTSIRRSVYGNFGH